MKISVKSSQGGGMFGGGPSSEVVIEGQDYEAGQATVSAMMLLAQNGIGEYPSGDDDETTESDVEDSPEDGYTESDGVPAAGWKPLDTEEHGSNPGDAVRIAWDGDQSPRLFIDSGTQWVSPAVAGLYDEPMSVEYGTTGIAVYVVAEVQKFVG